VESDMLFFWKTEAMYAPSVTRLSLSSLDLLDIYKDSIVQL